MDIQSYNWLQNLAGLFALLQVFIKPGNGFPNKRGSILCALQTMAGVRKDDQLVLHLGTGKGLVDPKAVLRGHQFILATHDDQGRGIVRRDMNEG